MEDAAGTMRWDEAISGWRSNFAAASIQLRRQRSDLLALVGQRLSAGWVGWDPVRDRWQPAFPLVLAFDGGVQLELAWHGWDDLSISWNTIDLSTQPAIVDRPHEWRSSQPHALAVVAGRVLTGWAVTEDPYFDGDADLTGGPPMEAVKGWVVQGLWIQFGGINLHVFDGASTTLVSDGYEEPTRVVHQQLPENATYGS